MLKALRFFGWPLLAGVLIALLIIQRYPQWVGLPSLDVNLQQAPQTTTMQQGPVSYADAVTTAAPSVVNLYTTKVINKPSHPLFEDPQFRRFFGDNSPKQKRMESSLGSGVIMSPEGYLLTNNHVTSGADQIVVALKDGRETLARVIGSDPETDLAVLKIDLKNLPSITVGRSDNIRIEVEGRGGHGSSPWNASWKTVKSSRCSPRRHPMPGRHATGRPSWCRRGPRPRSASGSPRNAAKKPWSPARMPSRARSAGADFHCSA